MPKTAAQARPADLKRTVRRLLSYMGHAKFSLLAVGMLASVAAIASLAGTYMVRPIVNGLATGGEELLTKQVIVTAIIYAAGVLSALGYSQIMVRAAQRVVSDIRKRQDKCRNQKEFFHTAFPAYKVLRKGIRQNGF